MGGGSSVASAAASTVGPSAGQVGTSIGAVTADPYWVMGVTATEKETTTIAAVSKRAELMMDTGSEDHVCRKDLCKDGKL